MIRIHWTGRVLTGLAALSLSLALLPVAAEASSPRSSAGTNAHSAQARLDTSAPDDRSADDQALEPEDGDSLLDRRAEEEDDRSHSVPFLLETGESALRDTWWTPRSRAVSYRVPPLTPARRMKAAAALTSSPRTGPPSRR